MTASETFKSFFVCQGLLDIGVKIAKHISARDLVAFMQVTSEFQDFVLENDVVRRLFITKAQDECPFKREDSKAYRSEMDYILDEWSMRFERDEKKMKTAVLRFKLEFQFLPFAKWGRGSKTPCSLSIAYELDQNILDDFTKEVKNLVRYCSDYQRTALLHSLKGRDRRSQDLSWIILSSLENKTKILDGKANTALHYLADASCKFEREPSPDIGRRLEKWIQSIPPGQLRCPINKHGESPLHVACRAYNLDVEIIKILCQNMTPDQVGLAGWGGNTALRDVCASGFSCVEIVKLLCQNMTTDQFGLMAGKTALHCVCKSRHINVEVVQFMCRRMTQEQIGLRADGDDADGSNRGYTALHFACSNSNSNVESVKILCHYMSQDQIELKTFHKTPQTALDLAVKNSAIFEFLSEICPSLVLTYE